MTTDPNETRERSPRTAATTAVMLATAVALILSGVHVFAPGQVLFPRSPLPKGPAGAAPAPAAAYSPTGTPSAAASLPAALTAAAAALLTGPAWSVSSAPDSGAPAALFAAPLCPAVAFPVKPAFTSSARFATAGTAVAVLAATFTAGDGGPAWAAMVAALNTCTRVDEHGSTLRGSATRGGQDVRIQARVRGDLIIAVIATSTTGSADADAARVMDALTAAAGPALTAACADAPVDLSVPPVAALAEPAPSAHPDLAVLDAPPVSAYTDTDGDGFAETPPPVAGATRGPAPYFIDPALIAVPADAGAPEPSRPGVPAPPTGRVAYTRAALDAAGPGCGWAFTGSHAPVVDGAGVAALALGARDAATATATADWAAYHTQMAAYAAAVAAWRPVDALWAQDAARRALYEAAVAAQSSAQDAYAASLVVFTTTLTPPVVSPTPAPGPSPAPSPSPDVPAVTP